jgi:Right handed beta helix region
VLSLSLEGPNHITVKGTCHEFVGIVQRERLIIQGAGPGAAIATSDPTRFAVGISDSKNILIIGLDISGGRGGVQVTRSTMAMQDCNVHDNQASPGISLFDSQFQMFGGSSSHNRRSGIVATVSSVILDTVDVSNNGNNGIAAGDVSSVFANNVTVQNNAVIGVSIADVSNLSLVNGTITGNGSTGLRVSETSHGEIFINTVIDNNGSADGGGGVYVSEKGEIVLAGPNDISNNTGHGVRGTARASISSLGQNTISGNSGDGIRLDRGSFEQFFDTDSLSGNARASIRCDNVSFIAGDPGTDIKVFCRRAAFDDDDDGDRDSDVAAWKNGHSDARRPGDPD